MGSDGKDRLSVAITGLSCRFPGDGDSLSNFWSSICDGKSAWSEIPSERFNGDAFWSGRSKNSHGSVTKSGHFLKDDVSRFDANFFSISRAEANAMDPQHRMMLEVTYEAVESAGYPLDSLAGTRTGVFMGHFTGDYKELVLRDADAMPPYATTGLNKTSLANRISWTFDLRGPSFSLDTACSSSLVAFHLACQSLRTGESDMAIVGGSSLLLNPEMFMAFSGQGFLSPDGKCKSFDASGDGYGRGEGIAVVILKRVDDAIAAPDPIRAIVRATGSNQDGHTKSLTLPRAEAQQALIQDVYGLAGLNFGQTGYVEAHGTGTQAGDREETLALSRTIAQGRSSSDDLLIGSVKANIGHLEAASGLAGVVKSALVLEQGLIPPQINFKNPNSSIKFAEWHLQVPTELTPWPTEGLRRVSINSFGYGGSNAHAILDDAYHYLRDRGLQGQHHTKLTTNDIEPDRSNEDNGQTDTPRIFVLTAQDRDGLTRAKTSLAAWLRSKAEALEDESDEMTLLADLAHTLNTRRSRLQWKALALGSSVEELTESLGEVSLEAMSSSVPHLGFVFTGQGAQWATMGTRLMAFPDFRCSIEAADQFLKKELGCRWSLQVELARGKATSRLGQALYSQTLCTALQVALVDLLRAWGIVPDAVVGHSSGEIAAAYCAGFLSRQHAWKIAYCRGVAAAKMKEDAPELDGAMMAVGASPEQCAAMIRETCPDAVDIACVNSPSSVTLSGDADAIDSLQEPLKEAGIFCRKLLVDIAYHSKHMRSVADGYRESIADVEPLVEKGTGCRMHSSVTKSQVSATDLGPDYWVRNLVSPVQFAAAVEDLMRPSATADAIDIFVEVGPHSALQGPVTQTLQSLGPHIKPYLPSLVRNKDQVETVLSLVGSLAVYGTPVDLERVNKTDATLNRTLIDLPSYAWNHEQQYWAESRLTRAYKNRKAPATSLLGAPVPSYSDTEQTWRGFLRPGQEEWVADHKIQGSVLYPGAGFLVMAVEAALQSGDRTREVTGVHLREVEFLSAMLVSQDRELEHTVTLRPTVLSTSKADGEWVEFVICSSPDGKLLVRNCHGKIQLVYQDRDGTSIAAEREAQARYQEAVESCHTAQKSEEFYRDLDDLGLTYGPAFAIVSNLSWGNGRSCGTLNIPNVGLESPSRPHIIHPATLDASFHLAFAAANSRQSSKLTVAMVPRSLEEMHLSIDIPYAAHADLTAFSNATISRSRGQLKAGITILDSPDAQQSVLEISGLRCVEIGHAPGSQETPIPRKLCSKLVWRPAADLLNAEETQRIVALTEEPGLMPGSNESIRKTGLKHLKEYLEIVHHTNLDIRIMEMLDGTLPLACDMDLFSDATRTVDYTIVCADEDVKVQLQDSATIFEGAKLETLSSVQKSFSDRGNEERSDLVLCWPPVEKRAYFIQNAKSLLKEGGKICLAEALEQVADSKALLLTNGFTYLYELGGPVAEKHVVLVASMGPLAVNPPDRYDKESRRVVLVRPAHMADTGEALATKLEDRLSNADCVVIKHTWGVDDISALQGQDCISCLELHSSLLENIQEKDFYAFQTLVLGCRSLLWLDALDGACSGLINGLSRVLRNEMPGIRLRTLHIPSASLSKSKVLSDLVFRTWDSETPDNEFLVQNDVIYVSRVVEDDDLNAHFSNSLGPGAGKLDKVVLDEGAEPLVLTVENRAKACFAPNSTATTQIESDEIEITVKAAAVSPQNLGVGIDSDLDDLPVFTAAGSVRQVGSNVTHFKVQDSVVIYSRGSPQTVQRCKASLCTSLPDGFTFEQAANAQAAYGASWYGLVHIARVSQGQSILIHNGATGIGEAAIKIALHYGMDVYATTNSEQQGALLDDLYGLPSHHVLSSGDFALGAAIKRLTGGRGVDVVFNSPGDGVTLWTCLAPFGTILEAGLHDSPESIQRTIPQGAKFSSFSLSRIAGQRPELMTEIVRGVSDLQKCGVVSPIRQTTVIPASAIQDAVDYIQNGGRATLSFQDGELLPVAPSRPSMPPLSGKACYVLVGGLGGLGRSIAMMLAENGAKKLCFLSRSGASSGSAPDLLRDLDALGAQAECFECDVSDFEAVASSLQRCSKKHGPIRGVIQCAMVLRDTLFSNMSYQDWKQSTLPKVQGTQNLHTALPQVDFFIILSSFAGTFGNRGQSNYAAGCAYQDALAIQRRREGKKATSLDVGLMRDVGVLAETGMTEGLKDWEGPYGVRERDLLDMVKLAIADRLPAQVLTGLATGGTALMAGIPTPFYLADAKFSIMARTDMEEAASRAGVAGSAVAMQRDSVRSLVSKSKDRREAADHVAAALVSRVAKLLELAEHDVDPGRALHSYGLDSLAAIEVVDWALKELEARINVFDVMAAEPITATATKIATASALVTNKGAK